MGAGQSDLYKGTYGDNPDNIPDFLKEENEIEEYSERDIKNQKTESLKKGIRSYEKVIEKHKNYIENPSEHVPNWNEISERRQNGLIKHWNKEIRTAQQSIENREIEIRKRGENNE